MKYYLAPMEGITGYIFRNTFAECFGGIDKYFTPFLAPNQNHTFTTKEKREILVENNRAQPLTPQLLGNRAEPVLWAAQALYEKGYREINLNLGCPSRTVVSKGRGAGFLAEPERLESFLDEVFSASLFASGRMKLSVKTRLGVSDTQDWERLLQIYNRYPLCELIIHARTQKDFYNGRPNWEAYRLACEISRHSLCYNGNLFSAEDVKRFLTSFPGTERIMLGRGVLQNPGLLQEIQNDARPFRPQLRRYHDLLYRSYREVLYGDRVLLFKMKELFSYWRESFPEERKTIKKLLKCNSLREYEIYVEQLLGKPELTL